MNMITRGAAPMTANPLIRYVNVTINNPTGQSNKIANFDFTYDRNILQVCGEHLCGVVSFSLPLQNLPLFIFPIVADQANPNLSTLQVGVCHNIPAATIAAGTSSALVGNLTSLIWQPQELGLGVPVQDREVQVVSPYHYCYAYEHFVNLVNVAVKKSWIQQGNIGGPGNWPQFSYQSDQHTFAWSVPETLAANVSGGAPGWSVCWNEGFDNLVNNFNTINNGLGAFILEDTLSAETNTVSTASGNVVFLEQDYPTTDAFNSAQRIICLTSSIPVAADYFAAPYGQYGGTGLSNTEKVLVDISLDFDNNVGAQRSTLVYNPNLYQLSDLESTLPLNRVSLKFQWADSLNNFYDIPVKQGEVISVKLGFFNKKLGIL